MNTRMCPRPRQRSRVSPSCSIQTKDSLSVPYLRAHHALCDEIKWYLEHVRDFLQSCGCSPSPSAFQVRNIALSDASLVRDVELRFTAPLANHAQCIFAGGNSVNNFFRNEWHARRNLSPRARDQTRSSDIFVGLTRLGGKCFVVLARKDSDLAFVGHFESDVHDAFLSVINLLAIADRNDSDRSGVFDEDNAPIPNSKPTPASAL